MKRHAHARPLKMLAGFALCVLALFAGCGPLRTKLPVVRGTITLDGAPVAKGSILFFPADFVGAPAEGAIKDGQFVALVPAGAKRVVIQAPRVLGKAKAFDSMPESMLADVIQETIPLRYNSQSELMCTVESDGARADFDLKTY